MMLSAVMEDYLKAIYELQGGDDLVTTSEIAAHLDVSPPTVTSMLGKLQDRELIDREKYKGVRLSARGETVALEVLRHHRLLEAYLTEELDYDWSEVHEEADALEHHISEEFERKIAAALDDPAVDPHGDPIPTEDLDPPEEGDGGSLTDYAPGDAVVIQRVRDRDPEELRYLAAHGITPATRVDVIEVAPFGMVTVKPEGTDETVSLPESIAIGVSVAPVVEEPA